MQSFLDTLLMLSVTVCSIVAFITGCGGKKKPCVMTDMPNTGDAKAGGAGSTSAPPAPNPAASQGDSKTPSKVATPETPSASKPPPSNPIEQSDKKASEMKKVPAGAVEDDGGYENCKDMSPEDLKKALVP